MDPLADQIRTAAYGVVGLIPSYPLRAAAQRAAASCTTTQLFITRGASQGGRDMMFNPERKTVVRDWREGWQGSSSPPTPTRTISGPARTPNFTTSRPHAQPQPQPLDTTVPLGPVVDSISINSLLIEEQSPEIQDVKYVSSYNWVDGKAPVILVPGSPPAWSPPMSDSKLSQDSQDVFRDINAARYPSYPMEPTIRAILAIEPEFDLQELDIIGCGSTFGNLLRCAGHVPRPFRFAVDIVGDTIVLIRQEKSPTEIIQDLRGYGHTFPEAYTTWDAEVRNSCSHQRIIQYDFGGIRFLVRSETDGYIKTKDTNMYSKPENHGQTIDSILGNLKVSSTKTSQDKKLEINLKGVKVPQTQIFDIKTRWNNKPYDMSEILPRLWINQTPNFLIAYHKFGLFDKPQIRDVRSEISQWENENTQVLAKFQVLIKRLVDVIRDSDDEQFEVSWDGLGPLLITKQIEKRRRALPSDLLQLWKSS